MLFREGKWTRLTNVWLASDKAASSSAFFHIIQNGRHDVVLVAEQQGESNAWKVLKFKWRDIKISNLGWEEFEKLVGVQVITFISPSCSMLTSQSAESLSSGPGRKCRRISSFIDITFAALHVFRLRVLCAALRRFQCNSA